MPQKRQRACWEEACWWGQQRERAWQVPGPKDWRRKMQESLLMLLEHSRSLGEVSCQGVAPLSDLGQAILLRGQPRSFRQAVEVM